MQSETADSWGARRSGHWLARRLLEVDWAGVGLRLLRMALFYAALVTLWWVVVKLNVWSPYILPAPDKVWHSLQHYYENDLLQKAVRKSLTRLLIGYSLSIMAGMIVGMACGANKYIDDTIGSLVLGLQSLPSVCWLPLAIIWFGLTERAIIFVVLMGSVFAVSISARAGFKSIPPLYRRAGLTMGANRYQMLRYVIIPSMAPGLAQGLKLGWSFAWRSLMAAEILNPTGVLSLGQLLDLGRSLNDMSLVIAVMLVIIVVGFTVDRLLFSRLESWVNERWGLSPG